MIVGGGSEEVEATAQAIALLFACGAPVIVAVAAGASYWFVRRSLQSVDAIRSRVAEISASDLAERVPVPTSRDEISALAKLAEVEACRARRGAQCTIHTDISPAYLIGDPAALSRVIRNLVDNAVRHAKSHVEIGIESEGDIAMIRVSDDGPGIAPADRSRVFERFVRLDSDRARSGGGTGLGLAIVAELVAAHDGTVAIDDRARGGTAMVVKLPQPSNR